MYYLSHSVKGSTWKKHKYVEKKNGRYIYKEDLARQRKRVSTNTKLQKTTNSGEIRDYKNLLEQLAIEQKLAEINRPLPAKIEKVAYELYDKAVDALKSTGVLDKMIESQQLAEELERLKNEQKERDVKEEDKIRKAWEVERGKEMTEWAEKNKEKRIQENLEWAKQMREDSTAGIRAREERKNAFRSRISVKR